MSQDELAVMDGGKCVLQLRGVRPFLSNKYDITKHPNYKYTSDFDNGKLRAFLIALMLLVFASGLAFLLYPYLLGAMVDREISLNAQDFLNRDETAPTIPEVVVTIDSPTEPEETRDYPELWADISLSVSMPTTSALQSPGWKESKRTSSTTSNGWASAPRC